MLYGWAKLLLTVRILCLFGGLHPIIIIFALQIHVASVALDSNKNGNNLFKAFFFLKLF